MHANIKRKKQQFRNPILFTRTIPLYQIALQGQVSIHMLKVSGWCTAQSQG